MQLPLLSQRSRGQTFSIQTRFCQGDSRVPGYYPLPSSEKSKINGTLKSISICALLMKFLQIRFRLNLKHFETPWVWQLCVLITLGRNPKKWIKITNVFINKFLKCPGSHSKKLTKIWSLYMGLSDQVPSRAVSWIACVLSCTDPENFSLLHALS